MSDTSLLRSAAAILLAVPGMECLITTRDGEEILVGDRPDATMCSHGLHQLVSDGLSDNALLPAVADISFNGLNPATGLASGPNRRWFVSPLSATETVTCLRNSRHVLPPYVAMVRDDESLDVSVVCIAYQGGAGLKNEDLDEVALNALAACVVGQLLSSTATSR